MNDDDDDERFMQHSKASQSVSQKKEPSYELCCFMEVYPLSSLSILPWIWERVSNIDKEGNRKVSNAQLCCPYSVSTQTQRKTERPVVNILIMDSPIGSVETRRRIPTRMSSMWKGESG